MDINRGQSSIVIDEDLKVGIIISVMSSLRTHIVDWNARSYTATSWSTGILIGIPAFWFTNGHSDVKLRLFLAVSTLLFGVLGQIYLYCAHGAMKANGRAIVRCETALQLNKSGFYINDESFFNPSPTGEWTSIDDIVILRWFQSIVAIISVLSILLFGK
ncbi:hypothetical protein ACH5Y9_10820 [Methylomonas sp. BW4-1]|uniref:hypothetical protein n=1 Tax=Methylomonas sp. BW4-1 TaxID=3376685 RepID=UPI0040422A48